MKKILLFFYANLFVCATILAQSPCETLNQGIDAYQEGKYTEAIELWKGVVTQTSLDTSACFGKCFNNIPVAYLDIKDTANAITWRKKALAYPLNNKLGGDNIMEPYINFHYFGCSALVSIYADKQDYKTALAYLDSMETKYNYQTFSGTSFEKWSVRRAMWRADLYEKAGDKKSALFALLKKTLDRDMFYYESFSSLTNVPFYPQLNERLLTMIEKQYGSVVFKKKLDKALESITLIAETKGKRKLQRATLKFYGKEIVLGISSAKTTKADLIKYLKSTDFYALLK